jgi:hypothetical protein
VPDRFQSEPFGRPRQIEPFYTVAVPCEACGRPTDRRQWNAEHELWIGVDCVCTREDETPVCPGLLEPILAARSVLEIQAACKAHREHCEVCNPGRIEPQRQERKPWPVRKAA